MLSWQRAQSVAPAWSNWPACGSAWQLAQAVPSVAPGAAARYFNKTECFCFTSQEFQPHEERELKLAFLVAPDLPAHVDTLSLAYTYFSAAN